MHLKSRGVTVIWSLKSMGPWATSVSKAKISVMRKIIIYANSVNQCPEKNRRNNYRAENSNGMVHSSKQGHLS